MLLERAELQVKPGTAEEFSGVLANSVVPLVKTVPGVGTVQTGRGVESPDKFMLLIEWESLEAHGRFPQHARYGEFRELLAPFTVGGAMEHFQMDLG